MHSAPFALRQRVGRPLLLLLLLAVLAQSILQFAGQRAAAAAEPVAQRPSMWLTPAEIAALPTSGPAWQAVKSAADGSWESANLADNNNEHVTKTLAGALVFARPGSRSTTRRPGPPCSQS
jgi:hypothetical protein